MNVLLSAVPHADSCYRNSASHRSSMAMGFCSAAQKSAFELELEAGVETALLLLNFFFFFHISLFDISSAMKQ